MRSILLLITVFFFTSLHAQNKITVTQSDFKPALGELKGTLTYLDYGSGKPFTMPANITLSYGANAGEIILGLAYPKEPKANGNDTLRIGKNGTEIDGAVVISKKLQADGSLQLITEKKGVDGNDSRKAVLRHIYVVGQNNFSNRKEVKFDGEEKWILRNEYSFTRQ